MSQASAPAVSVLMAVYNCERFVEEAVRSVLTQSFTDFELIIVDDGSSDGSLAILSRLAAADPRIRLSSQPNQGIPRPANVMIGKARGRYLSLFDHDDVMVPQCLQTQVDYLEAHPECGAVGVLQRRIDPEGRPKDKRSHVSSLIQPQSRRASNFSAFPPSVPIISNTASMVRAEAMRAIGGYREQFVFGSDSDLWFRLAETSEIHRLNKVLVNYRLHGGNATMARRQTVLLYDIVAHLSAMARAAGLDDAQIIGRFSGPDSYLATVEDYKRLIGASYPAETYVLYRAVGSKLPLAVGAKDYAEVLRKAFSHAGNGAPSLAKLNLLSRTLRRAATTAFQSAASE